MRRFSWLLMRFAVFALAISGCAPITPVAPDPFSLRVITTDLENPLEILYGPDGYLWVTERTGKRVTRVDPADGSLHVALTLPDVYQRTTQDGLLGMALHPEMMQNTGNDYVYLSYTYAGESSIGARVNRIVRIVRYTYDADSETLGDPVALLDGLPGSGDHNSAKMVIGPDEKLYYAIGDQGNNQFGNMCRPILAQELPTAAEVEASDWSKYPGKVLRLNLDGSIPSDNPVLAGVQSHVYSYGHRNIQGLVASPDGLLYTTEHGPKTDDEVNRIEPGANYGWPHVAGYQDDQAYVYGNWSASSPVACETLEFSDFAIPDSVPQQRESEWSHPDFVEPLLTFGTVADDYPFQIPECAPNYFICWPTVAPTGLELYRAQPGGVPDWPTSLLATALKTGSVYRMELSEDGRSLVAEAEPIFKTTNRYRDLAIHPNGRVFYIITDSGNSTQDERGFPTNRLEHPGAILEFSYNGED